MPKNRRGLPQYAQGYIDDNQGHMDELAAEGAARGAPRAGTQSGLQGTEDALARQLGYISADKKDTLLENRRIGRVNNTLGAGYGSFGAMGRGSGFMGNEGRHGRQRNLADMAPKPVSAQTPASAPAAAPASTAPTTPTEPAAPSAPKKRRLQPGQGKRPVAPGMGDGGMVAQMNYVREKYPFEFSQVMQMFFNDAISPFDMQGIFGGVYQQDLQQSQRKSRRQESEDV